MGVKGRGRVSQMDDQTSVGRGAAVISIGHVFKKERQSSTTIAKGKS